MNMAGRIAKYFATSLAMEKVVEGSAGHQELLANLDHFEQLRRIAVEVDHVAGLFGGLRAGVHRHADVGLGKRRGIVRAVAGHCHELAFRLLLFDQPHLVFGRGLGEKVIDPGLGGDRLGSARIVAGDHHCPNAHGAKASETVRDPDFDNVLEVNDAQYFRTAGDRQRRSPFVADSIGNRTQLSRYGSAEAANVLGNAIDGSLADHVAVHVAAAHSRIGAERDELGPLLVTSACLG